MIKVECTESSGCFVNFPIIFFDDCYLLRVANFLTHIQKSIVKVKNLQMYPMNKIQLIWAGDPILTDVQLPKPVFLTGNVEAVRNFILPADSREAADHFVKLMQERPWSLTYLQLQYDVIATKTSSKTINVDFGKVAKTDFITSLTNKMHNKSESDYYYIESNDYSQLCREVSQKIVASQITKGFFNISSKNQINLPEILQFYIHDKTFTANDNNEIWKSVFWQNDWTNPDTLRTFLNSQNHTRTGNKQRFRLNNDNVHTYDLKNHANGKFSESVINANGGVKIPGIFETSINVEHNKGSGTEKNQTHTTADNNSVSLTQDQIDSFLDENGNYVKWTGEKFTIKPVKLHRINKGRIDRNETFTIRLTHGESFGIQSTLSLNSVIADMNAECSGLQEPTTSSKATTTHKITTISTTTPSSTTSTTEKPFQFKILLSGGIDPNRPAGFLRLGWKSTEYYFPQRAVQGKLASDMLIERYGHISQLLSNGQVVIAGGRRYALWLCCKRDPKITPFVAETEIFDPAQNTRKKTGKLNGVREFSGSAVIDDVVYICGGFAVCCCCGSGGKTDADKLLENCERYRSGQWQYIKQMSVKRAKFVMVAVKGRLYAIGGYTNTSITGLNGKESNTAEVYNPNTNTWTKIASMHTKRADAAAAVLGNMIYVCGGSDKGCEKYDTELDKWTKDVAPMTTERSLHILVAASGHLFAIGGRASGSNFGGVARTAEMYSPKTNKWVPINPLIEKRWGATAVVI